MAAPLITVEGVGKRYATASGAVDALHDVSLAVGAGEFCAIIGPSGCGKSTLLGMVGVFIANGYETLDKKDTMPSLVAVLDTNFWLATHVTTVTLGYAAGLLAAAIGNVWLLGKMVGLRKGDREFYRSLTRMTYGIICFGLLFSVIGTILGGIWANYSFKEIGAPGLDFKTNYVIGVRSESGKAAGPDTAEYDATIEYRFQQKWLSGLWIQIRGAWVSYYDNPGDYTPAINDYRFIFNYEIPLL